MSINRRDFLKISTLSGAGLVLGFRLPDVSAHGSQLAAEVGPFQPNVYLKIGTDNTVTITVPKSEMGQGVQTALPMIVAEELDADWSRVRAEQALADSVYGNQLTGGSTSIQDFYTILRGAGAVARDMLLTAAAMTWSVDKTACATENGFVINTASGDRLAYGDLAELAATLEVPRARDLTLKEPENFKLIGTRQAQINNPEFVTGTAIFASDLVLPGMLYAVVARCPVFGGTVASFDGSKAEAVPGVRQVVEIDSGIAVVADSTWAAIQGRAALDITWDEGDNAEMSTESIRQTLFDVLDPPETSAEAATVLEAVYDAPYLAHATMEPMVCVADVTADRCEVWAPTQDRSSALSRALSASGVPRANVILHVPLIGCGCGRRLVVDYVPEAVQISKAVGAPVKVQWTRDDDIQHDYYRPLSVHWLRAEFDAQNQPISWTHIISSQGIGGGGPLNAGLPVPYELPARTPRARTAAIPVPVTYWRSVYNTQNAFVNECFIDEMAATSGQDPYEFRLSLLPEGSSMRGVLQLAAEKSGWGTPLPEGWGRGIACHNTWGVTDVAQVAEVSVEEGQVRVHRVVCAVNCGLVVNPDMVEAQMEGGLLFGLSAALYGEITLEQGRVQQSNFNNYPVLRFDESPNIEVYIVPSESSPMGVGEMGVPPIFAAVTNAVFAATGKRIRKLPFRAEDLR